MQPLLGEQTLPVPKVKSMKHKHQVGSDSSTTSDKKATQAPAYMLYVHIPFCERLCPYCSFNRYPFNEPRARAYFAALRKEMQMLAQLGYEFASMYIGGGTPTILPDELCATIDYARQLFDIKEVSCETNPNHLLPKWLDILDGRVQRLSVGVQSFDDSLLEQMQRLDKYGTGLEILERLKSTVASGRFLSLNADMIFNFPSQTVDKLIADLAYVLESGVNQTTFYPLMASPAVEQSLAASVGQVDYQREAEYYEIICEALTHQSPRQGFRRNEQPFIEQLTQQANPTQLTPPAKSTQRNKPTSLTHSAPFSFGSAWTFNAISAAAFQNPAMIDEYIIDYEEYPAIGAGGFSYLDGSLYINTFSVDEYIKRINSGSMSVVGVRHFSTGDRMRYRLMMQLFGLDLDKIQWQRDFGVSLAQGLPAEYSFFKAVGALTTRPDNPDHITLTAKGRYLSLALMREFFVGVNGLRDQARAALPTAERELLFG
jgi:coproporphyrinogen III oxidase-like Fe-S oxidoreductase